jgi:gliding motility-associated-like protein
MLKFKWPRIFVFLAGFLIVQRGVSQSAVAISLNEYQVTNTSNNSNLLDNYGEASDWVELYNNFTSTVSLNGYYLSNDRTNLKKWQFPSTFTMALGGYAVVWMSGRNEAKTQNGLQHLHTNFKIDQCKNQWIILTAPNGVVRDSIFVQRTKENHTRGRILGEYSTLGVTGWRVYTSPTFSAPNNVPGYIDYCPQPNFTEFPGIGAVNSPTFSIYLDFAGQPIDTSCFRVYYTTDGTYPTPTNPTALEFIDDLSTPLFPPMQSTIFRVACYPKSTATITPFVPPTWCETNYLPSFCQTNTYLSEGGHLEADFNKKFGVLSLAVDDPNWFLIGVPATTVHAEYFEMNASDPKKFVTEGYARLTKPINESWFSFQKGFNIEIDDRLGFGCNFEGPIFNVPELGTSTRTLFPILHVSGGDFESHSAPASNTALATSEGTGLRDVFVQTLAAKHNLNVNPLHIKPVAVFMNGKYAGTYHLKEVYDKHYEAFYNKQTETDKTTMLFYHNGEGIVQTHTSTNNWFDAPQRDVYKFVTTFPFSTTTPTVVSGNYNILKNRMDIPNFMDWTIMNSYFMNSNLYNYNIAMAKGSNTATPAGRWHHYLWNMPAILQFTAQAINSTILNNAQTSPCAISQPTYPVSPNGYNGQGIMFWSLMNKNGGNAEFRRDYITRYQDLLNGALSCRELINHWNDINKVYRDEMKKHEDPATTPLPGFFMTQTDLWDTNMSVLKRAIEKRCEFMEDAFSQSTSCYGLIGPYNVVVDVKPAGAGKVKLNTNVLPYYPWSGNYFKGGMSFKAIPNDSFYVFDHWEIENHPETNARPLSLDSIGINFSIPKGDRIVAVFTDRKEGSALPTAFSPNGDGRNDLFGVLGAGKYSRDFEMRIWNRWGQEVYRTSDPAQGWDGNFNGAQAQTGVYAYFITYKDIYGEVRTYKGNVTLVR